MRAGSVNEMIMPVLAVPRDTQSHSTTRVTSQPQKRWLEEAKKVPRYNKEEYVPSFSVARGCGANLSRCF